MAIWTKLPCDMSPLRCECRSAAPTAWPRFITSSHSSQPGSTLAWFAWGTACYIKGAQQLVETLKQELGASPGETTPDGKVSVLSARCLGSCGLAPAVVYDSEVAGKVTSEQLRQQLAKWNAHDS